MTTARLVSIAATSFMALTLGIAPVRAQEETERIGVLELRKKLDSGEKLLLIDVRRDDELEEHGAIPGAIHIPMAELDERMVDIPKDVRLVFY